MTLFGFDVSTNTLLIAGAVALWAGSRKDTITALLGKLSGFVTGATSKAKGLLSPETGIAEVMGYLTALDAYSDKHGLGWTEDLKKMMQAASNIEFDRVTDEAG